MDDLHRELTAWPRPEPWELDETAPFPPGHGHRHGERTAATAQNVPDTRAAGVTESAKLTAPPENTGRMWKSTTYQK